MNPIQFLFLMIENGEIEEVKRMCIEDHRLLHAKSDTGCSLIIRAAMNNQLEIAKWLVENGSNANDLANGGQSALMWAFQNGNEALIRLLIDNGADLNYFYEDYEDEYALSVIINNWIKDEDAADMLDIIDSYRHLLNPKVLSIYKKERLPRLLQDKNKKGV